MMGWRRTLDPETYLWHINHWFMPHSTVMGALAGGTFLSNMRVPIDDEHSWQFRIRWNTFRPLSEAELHEYRYGGTMFPELIPGTFRCVENRDSDYLIDREKQRTVLVTGIKSQTQQDRAVNEPPPTGPIYDRTKEHLGTSDAVIIQMRRVMIRAARALAAGQEPFSASHGAIHDVRPIDIALKTDVPFEEGAGDFLYGHRRR